MSCRKKEESPKSSRFVRRLSRKKASLSDMTNSSPPNRPLSMYAHKSRQFQCLGREGGGQGRVYPFSLPPLVYDDASHTDVFSSVSFFFSYVPMFGEAELSLKGLFIHGFHINSAAGEDTMKNGSLMSLSLGTIS